MSKMNENFSIILEKKFVKEGVNYSYLKPDISFKYDGLELKIELKLGNTKQVVKNFYKDVKKIKEYPFSIALCYDPGQYILRDNEIIFHQKDKKISFINNKFNPKIETKIYYAMEREIVTEYVLKNRISSERIEKQSEKDIINLAFAIHRSNEN